MILYKYICRDCETYTYVEWEATEDYTFPCCAECGRDNRGQEEIIAFITEVQIKEAE